MKKRAVIIFVMLLCVALLTTVASAHSGRTDSNGGHYDRSTGSYHYHHGYSAHQHPNGVCPYANNQRTNNSNSSVTSADKANNDGTLLFIALVGIEVCVIVIVIIKRRR